MTTIVEQVRDIRDKINEEIKNLSFEELKKYLEKQGKLHSDSSCGKK
jgi:hypothetical protein